MFIFINLLRGTRSDAMHERRERMEIAQIRTPPRESSMVINELRINKKKKKQLWKII